MQTPLVDQLIAGGVFWRWIKNGRQCTKKSCGAKNWYWVKSCFTIIKRFYTMGTDKPVRNCCSDKEEPIEVNKKIGLSLKRWDHYDTGSAGK